MAVKPNRKRYILFEIISDKEIGFELSKRAILDSAEKLIGSLGISKADLRLLPDFYSKNQGVISVNHDYIPKIKLAVALIQRIGSQDVIFRTKRVFGTLRKIKNMF
jgi:RNase P/RNase MRP subunit POP5